MAMHILGATTILAATFVNICLGELTIEPLSTVYLPFEYDANNTAKYGIGKSAAEQSTFDHQSNLIYTVGESLMHIIDATNPYQLTVVGHQNLDGISTDVEVCGSMVAVSMQHKLTKVLPGKVVIYQILQQGHTTLSEKWQFEVGALPDMIHFTKNCSKLVVANEGEAGNSSSQFVDPEGGVSIITFNKNNPAVKNLNFTKFNSRAEEYVSKGVRWVFRGHGSISTTFSQDLEPEYVTFSADERYAFIGLQENNAMAKVDLIEEDIVELYPLGYKNWNLFGLDASDRDGAINLQNYQIHGMCQPDSIEHFMVNGEGYIVGACEGDAKDYKDLIGWTEETRGSKLSTSSSMDSSLKSALNNNTKLGRLRVTTVNGKNKNGTEFDSVYAFGGRSFAIWYASNMSLVYDSGASMELTESRLIPTLFNSQMGGPQKQPTDSFDKRSDNKGPECESLDMFTHGSKHYFVIGNERTSTLHIYSSDVDHVAPVFETMLRPGLTNDTWQNLYDLRKTGDLDPEYLSVISPEDSPVGQHLILVSGSVSGTVSMYKINGLPILETTTDTNDKMPKLSNHVASVTKQTVTVVSASTLIHQDDYIILGFTLIYAVLFL